MKTLPPLTRVLLLASLVLLISCSSGATGISSVPKSPSSVASPIIYNASPPPLGVVPTTCDPPLSQTRDFFKQNNTDTSTHPNALGEAGVWAIGFRGPNATLLTQYQNQYGYGAKIVWFVDKEKVKEPIVVTGTNVQTGRPLVFFTTGKEEASREMKLDPRFPNHPISVAGPNWSEWGSEIYYPTAGCYRLAATWKRGTWSYVIAAGSQ